MFEQLKAYAIGSSLVALTAWPAFVDPAEDSYPLSTYPMFSTPRGKPYVLQVVARDEAGAEEPLPPHFLGNHETLQAAAAIQGAVREGRAKTLCKKVAKRVAQSPDHARFTHVAVQGARFDAVAYLTEGREPIFRKRYARCRVRR